MSKTDFFENIKTYKYSANKSLGQNFLVDSNVCEKIVNELEVKESDTVLEIGAGLGSLSYYLVKTNAQTTLIDIDEQMLIALHNNFDKYDNVEVLRQNILKYDVSNFTKIIGNLPYYITSGIIEHLLLNAKNAETIVLMTQKEVLQKLLPSSKEISPLTLLLNYVAELKPALNVSRNCFVPVPHVDSSVFKLIPNANIKNEENKEVYKLMCNIFLHRRKTILNCLTNIVKDKNVASDILKELNTSELLRPEQLNIEFYFSLKRQIKKHTI